MNTPVATASNLFDYFNVQVCEAARGTGTELSHDTQLYLTSLLVERARVDQEHVTAETLAEIHGRAATARPSEKARAYRELGDRALYSVGYFPEHCTRRVVSERYYLEMGSAAYYQVDQVFKRWFADAFGPVFRELSAKFATCVTVFNAVRDFHRDDDLIHLYQRWLQSGSSGLADRLHQKGLLLPSKPTLAD